MDKQLKMDFDKPISDPVKGEGLVYIATNCKMIDFNEYIIKNTIQKKKEEEEELLRRVLDLKKFLPDF